MDQELVQYLDGRFNEVSDRIDEVKRHSGVLAEGLHREVRLVAESLAVHVEAEGVRHQAIQEQFRETRALIHLSYEQLHQRVENLERKDQN
jgi:ubiquinone biosynthesis protein UbiJ